MKTKLNWKLVVGFTGKAAPGAVPAQAENVLFSRVQWAF